MIVFESRLVRRLVGRLERGEEVIATLRQHCEAERVRGGWIRGVGILEWVELTEWDAEREVWKTPRRVDGPLTVVSLEGTVAIRGGPVFVELHVGLTKQDDLGIHALGGTIASARVYALDFTIESFEDVRLERDEDPSTGLALFKGSSSRGVLARESGARGAAPERAAPAPQPARAPVLPRAVMDRTLLDHEPDEAPAAPAPSGPVSWAQVAAVSQRVEKGGSKDDPAFLSEPHPQKGDWIDHRQFGLCRVDGEDEDGGLKIRLPSGVRKVIKLDFLEVLPPRHEGDRKVFPLRPRKR